MRGTRYETRGGMQQRGSGLRARYDEEDTMPYSKMTLSATHAHVPNSCICASMCDWQSLFCISRPPSTACWHSHGHAGGVMYGGRSRRRFRFFCFSFSFLPTTNVGILRHMVNIFSSQQRANGSLTRADVRPNGYVRSRDN